MQLRERQCPTCCKALCFTRELDSISTFCTSKIKYPLKNLNLGSQYIMKMLSSYFYHDLIIQVCSTASDQNRAWHTESVESTWGERTRKKCQSHIIQTYFRPFPLTVIKSWFQGPEREHSDRGVALNAADLGKPGFNSRLHQMWPRATKKVNKNYFQKSYELFIDKQCNLKTQFKIVGVLGTQYSRQDACLYTAYFNS